MVFGNGALSFDLSEIDGPGGEDRQILQMTTVIHLSCDFGDCADAENEKDGCNWCFEATALRTTKNRAMGEDTDILDAGEGMKNKWPRVVKRLRSEFGEDLYSSWFARMEFEELRNGRLVVSVPTRFLRNWIESHYQARLFRLCVAEYAGIESVFVRVRTRGLPQARTGIAVRDLNEPVSAGGQAGNAHSPLAAGAPGNSRGSVLDQSLTFETFVLVKDLEDSVGFALVHFADDHFGATGCEAEHDAQGHKYAPRLHGFELLLRALLRVKIPFDLER